MASFRSTLDEALEASLLLYVVDASDPTCEAQLEVTRDVLNDIGADEVPSLLLLNKVDRMDRATKAVLKTRYPDAVVLERPRPEDVAALRQRIIEHFEASMVEAELLIPYARQGLVAEVYEHARVTSETFDETGRRLVVRALPAAVTRLTRLLGA